jgi:hypothetical protein
MDGTTRTLSYAYDAAGNRLSITHPDGTWFGMWYDGLNRRYYIHANNTLGMAMLGFAPHGGVAWIGRVGIASYIGFDAVQRPSSLAQTAYTPSASTDVAFSYTRNPASQITSTTRDNDAYAWGGHYAATRAYTANGLNQYSAISPAGGTALSLTYDANGNLTSDGSRTYTYDSENRLLSSSNGATLSYDPLGRLYQVTLGTTTTRFLYDGDALATAYLISNPRRANFGAKQGVTMISTGQRQCLVQTSADADGGWRQELIIRHFEIVGRRAFADAGGGIVGRAVAGTEIAAILAARLALGRAQRHAAQMGADAERDQPVAVAFLGPLGERLRVAQRGDVDRIGGVDLGRGQIADEDRLLAPDRLDRLAGADRGDVDVDLGKREHVRRRVHLVDQGIEQSGGADPGDADRGDVDEVAAADAVCFATLVHFNRGHDVLLGFLAGTSDTSAPGRAAWRA